MKDIDWRTLTILQDDLVKLEQNRKKQRETYHKLLYKNDLEKMITERRNHERMMKQDEKRTYNQAYKSLDHHLQQTKSKRLYTRIRENSDYNFSTGISRKNRQLNEIHQDRLVYKDRFRRVETEEFSQKNKEVLELERKRKELAQFYQSQINNVTSKKYLQKLQNKKFEELAREIQAHKEQQRLNNLNKIRFGYYQNPETFSTIKHIYSQTQQQKLDLLKKIETSRITQNDKQKSREKVQQQINETSRFNRNCFLQKQLKKQQHLLKTIEDDNNKIVFIQQRLTEQNEQQAKKKKMLKLNLKTQLESQMFQASENRVKWKKMNEHELKMNQPYAHVVQPVSIPGLYRDYKDIKREEMIDKFLVNQKYSLPSPYPSKTLSK